MIVTSNYGEVYSTGVSSTEQFKFSNSPIIFKILSDSLYSNKINSIVRELCCNARDSHVAAGKKDVPFEIHLPTQTNMFNSSNSYFSVKDYGTGLSEEEIYNLYTVYGDSNKRDSNEYIGGFGIGSKSPFAYTESFTIISRNNGKKTTYSAFINSDGFPSITKVLEVPTEEENGVEVSFAVSKGDEKSFSIAVEEELKYFSNFPKVSNGYTPPKRKELLSGDGWRIEDNNYYIREFVLLIGEVPYYLKSNNTNISYPTNKNNLIVEVPIGKIDLSASRESIAFTQRTNNNLKEIMESVKANVLHHVISKIETMSDYDKRCFLTEVSLSPYEYRGYKDYDEHIRPYTSYRSYDKKEFDEDCKKRKCSVKWIVDGRFSSTKMNQYVLKATEKCRIIFIPVKNSTLDSIKTYVNDNKIRNCVVVRYHTEDDIEYFKNLLGNPSDRFIIFNPELVLKKKETTNTVGFRTFNIKDFKFFYKHKYISNSNLSFKSPMEILNDILKKNPFVFLSKNYEFIGGIDWSNYERQTIINELFYISNQYPDTLLSNFPEIVSLSNKVYGVLKKEGLRLTSYDEAYSKIIAWKNDVCSVFFDTENAKYLTQNVEHILTYLIRDFSKEECLEYSKKVPLFELSYKLYDVINNEVKRKMFYNYAKNIIDKEKDNVYNDYIKKEPLFELMCSNMYNDNEMRNCILHYILKKKEI